MSNIEGYKTMDELVDPIFDDFKRSYNDFLRSHSAWKQTKNARYLILAKEHLQKAIDKLNELIRVAENTKNQKLKEDIIETKGFVQSVKTKLDVEIIAASQMKT
jgi:flagellar motility protein MotE (MotC chaperone)